MTGRYDLDVLLGESQLPALPQSAVRLLELSQDPTNGPPEFTVPIESDPGLTGQVLRFVNSSYFGFADEVTSIRLAITLVGVRTINNFALWSAVFSLIPNPKCGPLDVKTLWQDSLRRALFAREVARQLKSKDVEEVFTAGLLQDMAIPLLAKELTEEYAELLESREDGNVRLSELEQERFGWNHGDAAAIMATSWSLPSSFTRLLKGHTQVDQWQHNASADPALFAIGLSSLLPTGIDSGWTDLNRTIELFEQGTGFDSDTLRETVSQVDTLFDEFAPVLRLSDDACSLVSQWQEASAVS
jgi:HD-like signal output (HDOD) protein